MLPIDVASLIFMSNMGIPTDKFCVRVFIFALYINEMCKVLCGFILVGLMVVVMTNGLLHQLDRVKGHELFVFEMYRKLQIWNQYTNMEFCRISVPPLLWFGSTLGVLTTYGSIRFRGLVNPIFFSLFPITSVSIILLIQTLVPQAALLNENSTAFLKKARSCMKNTRRQRRWKSCQPLRIQNGTFGVLKKSTVGTILRLIVDSSINLLLTW